MKKVAKKAKQYRQKNMAVFGLGRIPEEGVPEIKIRYTRTSASLGKVTDSKAVYDFLRKVYPNENIELQEQAIILYLNRANEIIGYYRHTIGGITGVTMDVRLIYATALASASSGIILSHNHPSGNLTPSQPDKDITKKIQSAGRFLDINVLDHLIVTKNGYYSFADEALL